MAVSDEILARYRKVAVATIYSAVRELGGYEPCFMRGVNAYTSQKTDNDRLAGRAKTVGERSHRGGGGWWLGFAPPGRASAWQDQGGDHDPRSGWTVPEGPVRSQAGTHASTWRDACGYV